MLAPNEIKNERSKLSDRHAHVLGEMQELIDSSSRSRREFLPAEAHRFTTLDNEAKRLSSDIARLSTELESALEGREARSGPAPSYLDSPSEKRNAKMPNDIPRDTCYPPNGAGGSYFRDLLLSQVRGDFDARDRLTRHKREIESSVEFRDLNRTDTTGGEFVPPVWLIDLYASVPRGSRVTADLVRQLSLPGGTDSLNVPKITTGTAVNAQTADNATVSETDIVSTSVAAPVITLAGQQDVSLQLLEQSPTPGIDQIIFTDLMADLDQKLDVQVLNGTAANGQVQGILEVVAAGTKVAYTDASPTQLEFIPSLFQVIAKVAGARKQAVTALVMHPRRWYWLSAGLDSGQRPYVLPSGQGPNNAIGIVMAGGAAQGLVGSIAGVPVYIDPSVPTLLTNGAGAAGTEDIVIAGRFEDAILWEGEIRSRVLPEIGSGTLTTRLQIYKYCAFQANRYPTAFGTIYDTGMASPANYS